MTVERVISGGQTGSDRGGLDAAIRLGIPHGGWCPAGRRAEDGRVPEHYRLTEAVSADYAWRTALNVRESDATLLFTTEPLPGPGSELTKRIASDERKPLLTLGAIHESGSAQRALDVETVRRWLDEHNVRVLNVAGSRESGWPGLQTAVADFLADVLALANYSEERPASPSEVLTWTRCERRWAFRYVDRLPGPTKPWQRLGTEAHACVERFIKTGQGPEFHGTDEKLAERIVGVAHAAIKELPERVTGSEQKLRGGLWHGIVDATYDAGRGVVGVWDLKTTSDLRNAKTADDLRDDDPAAVIYARLMLDQDPDAQYAELRWQYVRTRAPHKTQRVVARLSRAEVDERIAKLEAGAYKPMRALERRLRSLPIAPEQSRGDLARARTDACGDFGGCDYRDTCPLTNEERISGRMSTGQEKHQTMYERLFARQAEEPVPPGPHTTINRPPTATASDDPFAGGQVVNTPPAQNAPPFRPIQSAAPTEEQIEVEMLQNKRTGQPQTDDPRRREPTPAAEFINAAHLGAPGRGYLLLDLCLPLGQVTGRVFRAAELIAEANAEVCRQLAAEVRDWRGVEYGKGPGALREALGYVLDHHGPGPGDLLVLEAGDERDAVLSVLSSRAACVFRGTR